jgi:hypothetical protein
MARSRRSAYSLNMVHASHPRDDRAAPSDSSFNHEDLVIAAFLSSIHLATLHGEEVAAIAAMSFEERWALDCAMAEAVEVLSALRDSR